MEFKVLAIGDVVGNPGMERVRRKLRQLKRKTEADFVIVNGENASVVGITPDQAEDILDAGADVITLGNHSFGKREIVDYLEDTSRVLRPANLAPQAPGRGWDVYETKAGDVAVVDLIGRCNMDYTPDNPFLMVEKLLKISPPESFWWRCTQRPLPKSWPWGICWTAGSALCGEPTPMCLRRTTGCCPRGRAT